MNLMERMLRTRTRAVLVAALLLLCTRDPGPAEAGSVRGREPALDTGRGKSVLLSLKISRAKKKTHRVTLYKSVARQRKALPTCAPRPPSVR
ncbi:MAG TPA: hypothetical protein DDX05_00125 [Deltaproteobacteria bacterium]|nr:hypothetical protein [Deltaproteobacteria bacterium]